MRLILSMFSVLVISFSAFPWGRVGHATIAYIAEQNLTPATREKIRHLLAGQTIKDIAIWADIYKRSHRKTAAWHYINLPVRQDVTVADIPRYCSQDEHSNGDVISRIKIDIKEMQSPSTSVQEKQKALLFLIHLMADVHMPLHVGDDNDRGGNGKKVRFFASASGSNPGHLTNLHSLWDNLIAIKAADDPETLGAELCSKITSAEKKQWEAGNVETWAFESYTVAKTKIYDHPDGVNVDNNFKMVVNGVTVLPRDYYEKMRPVVDLQIKKAGVRLAKVLNGILK